MRKNIPTITIGIPAYNEEANIGHLLNSLMHQKVSDAQIVEMIVVSDGSTDQTANIAKKINDRRIHIVVQKTRRGVGETQDKILSIARGDILILINADALPADKDCIAQLIKPILKDERVGLVGADVHPVAARGLFESGITTGWELKKYIYDRINHGRNVYNCHGIARAFSRNFYTKLRWPRAVPEDSYSYFSCIKRGLKFEYTNKSRFLFRAPSTLSDHAKQSIRFTRGNEQLERYFPPSEINFAFKIPMLIAMKACIIFLLRHPLSFVIYGVVSVYIRIFIHENIDLAKWKISKTSKQVIG